MLHVGLPVHNQHLLVPEQKVTVVVAEVIRATLAGAVEVGEVAEVEAGQLEQFAAQRGLSLGAEMLQHKAVVPQLDVDAEIYQLFTGAV